MKQTQRNIDRDESRQFLSIVKNLPKVNEVCVIILGVGFLTKVSRKVLRDFFDGKFGVIIILYQE